MRKFGLWLDWMEFAHQVRRGEVEPPVGYDFSDMVRSGMAINEDLDDMCTKYIRKDGAK